MSVNHFWQPEEDFRPIVNDFRGIVEGFRLIVNDFRYFDTYFRWRKGLFGLKRGLSNNQQKRTNEGHNQQLCCEGLSLVFHTYRKSVCRVMESKLSRHYLLLSY